MPFLLSDVILFREFDLQNNRQTLRYRRAHGHRGASSRVPPAGSAPGSCPPAPESPGPWLGLALHGQRCPLHRTRLPNATWAKPAASPGDTDAIAGPQGEALTHRQDKARSETEPRPWSSGDAGGFPKGRVSKQRCLGRYGICSRQPDPQGVRQWDPGKRSMGSRRSLGFRPTISGPSGDQS